MHDELTDSIGRYQGDFDLSLSADAIERLCAYYEILLEHNEILHLVAPCSAEEFAIRHILEPLMLLRHLPENEKFADVGSGGGTPSLPCLLVRQDLKAVLIESKERKAAFLLEAVSKLGLGRRVKVVGQQFEEADITGCGSVTCRALDRFTERLPRILRWAGKRRMLLFGGPNLAEALRSLNVRFGSELMPLSDRRYLFSSE